MNLFELAALPFQWGSALRGKRFFHPDGVLAEGVLERVAPPHQGLPLPSSDVIARVSKATGTPGALPDFLGLAVRVPAGDAGTPWDVLLVSAGSGVLARAVALRPATSWNSQTLTTLMPVHYRGDNWWLRARTDGDTDGAGLSLDAIRGRLERGTIDVDIDQACGAGSFTPLARLTLTGVIDSADDVSFDPVANTAPGTGLHPQWLADLRGRAYRRSRDGRDAEET
ncbi:MULTISPECIES: phosphodiesterase [unclassified Mycobacterium]|uniref:phosphodiesterase n=1 Tax=unclassified Mycobacterium TaxID=2642494 RepID=UPI0007FE4724|nr:MULTISPECIES: phosphodiesterase [unclassified Mycobacterium]OBG78429.1 phosphodiesterase [Mycobacterium sp. E1214]OBH28202.1 phosphodiesterase [Mycobacterium sp. E1319]